MLLLYSVAIGLIVGRLAGGRLDGLTAVRFRFAPLALGGLLFQLVLFSPVAADRVGDLGPQLYVASTVAVLIALLANLRLPGLWILALGAGMNLVAITANGGWMPSAPDAWMALNGVAEIPTHAYTNSAMITAATAFPALGDIFVFPRPLPFANVFSLGDTFIAAGAIVFLVLQMRRTRTSQGRGTATMRPTLG